jgi:phosphoenolpyruvate carboxykinase (GTP)
MWPGFGENLRVLRWIIDRCEDRVDATETAIGFLPNPQDIDTQGLDISVATMAALTSIDTEQWQSEMNAIGEYLDSFGERLPDALRQEQQKVQRALADAS